MFMLLLMGAVQLSSAFVIADGHGGSGVLRCMVGFRYRSEGSLEILELLYSGRDSLFSVVCMVASTVGLGLI